MQEVVNRFLRYVQFETTSDENSETCPSTEGQLIFAQELVKELHELGLSDAQVDNNSYVMATLPGNTNKKVPVIGFISHLDTAPDFSGKNVKPQIIKNYRGGDILLNKEKNIYLRENHFPELKLYYNQDLITTDGTTLLGADDKAGIAEIISAVAYLIKHPEIEHGPIRIGFTPDEEIGKGARKFDVQRFAADYAYTVDGSQLGELETENFNAASATITIKGINVHTGSAKNKMVNSLLLAQELLNRFPAREVPSKTAGHEGFYHLHNMTGSIEKTVLKFLIRDHDRRKFNYRKEFIESCCKYINKKYGYDYVTLNLKDSYYNMKEIIAQHPHVFELALKALQELHIKPILTPIRGGTDGAHLSYMGLPTPNLFTGGHNFHGKYEFIPIPSMEKAVQTIVKICELAVTL